MDDLNKVDKCYRVVRYYPDFGVGVIEDVLGSHLSKEAAEKLAKENPAIVDEEHVFIEEEKSEPIESAPNEQ